MRDSLAEVVDQFAFLTGSRARVAVMVELLDEEANRRDVTDAVDASRSTVTRALSSLEERGWIREEAGTYCLTPNGRIVVEEFLDAASVVERADDLSEFLEWFPYSEFAFEFADLEDVTVTGYTESDPYAPARAQSELLATVDRFRGMLPSIELDGTRAVHERVMAGDLQSEILVSASVEETLETEEFAPLFREMEATGRHTTLVYDDELPFYVGLGGDGTVQLGVEDDEGFPRALLESTDASLREWADGIYREYRSAARHKEFAE